MAAAAHDVWSCLQIVEDEHAIWVQQVRAHAERLSYHDWQLILRRASDERLSLHDWQGMLLRMRNHAGVSSSCLIYKYDAADDMQ